MSFEILRSALLCLRRLRIPRRRNLDVKDRDLEIEKTSPDSTARDVLLIVFIACFIA